MGHGAEGRRRKAEGRRQRTEDRGQMTDVRGRSLLADSSEGYGRGHRAWRMDKRPGGGEQKTEVFEFGIWNAECACRPMG